MRTELITSFLKKTSIAVALAGVFMFAAAPRLRADDDDCHRRIYKADQKLHEAIEHHGYNSRQADHARDRLRDARERCWRENRRWWDEDGHRWHNDRDWDDRDHDSR